MKHFGAKLLLIVATLLMLVGLKTGPLNAETRNSEIANLDANTPLYFTDARPIDSTEMSYHYSHSSHRSHYSHQSHRSHYSHYSGW